MSSALEEARPRPDRKKLGTMAAFALGPAQGRAGSHKQGKPVSAPYNVARVKLDSDVTSRVDKVGDNVTRTVHRVATEPSNALFAVKEAVRRTIPGMVDARKTLAEQRILVDEYVEDIDYSMLEVRNLPSLPAFRRLKNNLQETILRTEAFLSAGAPHGAAYASDGVDVAALARLRDGDGLGPVGAQVLDAGRGSAATADAGLSEEQREKRAAAREKARKAMAALTMDGDAGAPGVPRPAGAPSSRALFADDVTRADEQLRTEDEDEDDPGFALKSFE